MMYVPILHADTIQQTRLEAALHYAVAKQVEEGTRSSMLSDA